MRRGWVRRFLSDSSGATALEFALIAMPLMLFTFGITEIGRALFMQQQLSFATDAAARELYIAPDIAPATLSTQIVDGLFLGDPDRLTVVIGGATPAPGIVKFETIHLTVNYEFQSLLPQLVTSQIPLNFERTVTIAK